MITLLTSFVDLKVCQKLFLPNVDAETCLICQKKIRDAPTVTALQPVLVTNVILSRTIVEYAHIAGRLEMLRLVQLVYQTVDVLIVGENDVDVCSLMIDKTFKDKFVDV